MNRVVILIQGIVLGTKKETAAYTWSNVDDYDNMVLSRKKTAHPVIRRTESEKQLPQS